MREPSKNYNLGFFDTEEQAAHAVDKCALAPGSHGMTVHSAPYPTRVIFATQQFSSYVFAPIHRYLYRIYGQDAVLQVPGLMPPEARMALDLEREEQVGREEAEAHRGASSVTEYNILVAGKHGIQV